MQNRTASRRPQAAPTVAAHPSAVTKKRAVHATVREMRELDAALFRLRNGNADEQDLQVLGDEHPEVAAYRADRFGTTPRPIINLTLWAVASKKRDRHGSRFTKAELKRAFEAGGKLVLPDGTVILGRDDQTNKSATNSWDRVLGHAPD